MHPSSRVAKIEKRATILRVVAFSLAPAAIAGIAGCSPAEKIAERTATVAATAQPVAAPGTPQPTEQQIAALARVQKLAAQWADQKIAALPRNNNFGILVCEPGTSNGDQMAHFGAGLARWMQFHIGGQGELGKTPAWREVEAARRALKKSSLQFSTVDAAQLPVLLGITHAVTGRIDKVANDYVLSLQLWKLEKRGANWETSPTGAMLELRGSREQLLQQLPKTARQISQRMGVIPPQIPQRVELNAAELQFLGSLSWDGKMRNASTQSSTHNALWPKLVQKSALASLMKVASGDEKLYSQLLQLAPRNALAWNAAGNPPDVRLQKLRMRFSRNYILSEKNAIENAPQNPHAWLQLRAPKREAFFAALQATRTAPRLATAWCEVSRRARVLDENEVAQLALWKSLRLDGTDEATYLWGEELLSKSGLNDAAQHQMLLEFRQRHKVSASRLNLASERNRSVEKIAIANENSPALNTELRSQIAHEEANLRRNERDAKVRARLAKLYEQNGEIDEARGVLNGWIALEPRNIAPLIAMAQLELKSNNRDSARKVLQRAQRIEPQNATVRQMIRNINAM